MNRFDRINEVKPAPTPPPPPDERSIHERINAGVYKNTLPYVRFDNRDESKKAAHKLYQEEEGRLHDKFVQDLYEHSGVQNNPKRHECFQKAWEHGHSSGHSEVVSYFEDLVDLIIETPEEKARIRLNVEDEYVIFAALTTMVDDIHAVQDNMTEEQWDLAEVMTRRLEQRINARQPAKPKKQGRK